MFLYFDENGLLKEQINDKSLRQGNSGVNTVYFYFKSDITSSNIYARYRDGNGNLMKTQFDISTNIVRAQIPPDKNRDLKYFNYYTDYDFYAFTIPSAVLEIPGAAGCTIRIVPDNEDSDITLSTFTFVIEESVEGDNYVASDDYVSLAQFQYLLNKINHKTIDFTVFTDSDDYYFERTYNNPPYCVIDGAEGEITFIMDDDKYAGIHFHAVESPDETLVVFYFRG